MPGIRVPSVRSFASRARLYFAFTRPFTLLPPTLGVVSGALCAFGSAHNPDPDRRFSIAVGLMIVLGSLTAALLNAASNVINQYHDLEIDRRNKPQRPLVSGAISPGTGLRFAALLYVLAIAPTWLIVVHPHVLVWEKATAPLREHQCFLVYLAASKRAHIVELERELELTKLDRDWFKREDAETRLVRGAATE